MERTKQKQEAIERMKMLQIHKNTIKEFDKENIVNMSESGFLYRLADELTESEMREFDGDIEEPHEIINTDKNEFIETDTLAQEKEFAKAFDNDAVCRLSDIIGDCFILV